MTFTAFCNMLSVFPDPAVVSWRQREWSSSDGQESRRESQPKRQYGKYWLRQVQLLSSWCL